MIALIVHFHVKEGGLEQFDELVARTVAEISRLEPETLVYLSTTPEAQPGVRVFIEIYRDQLAFERHEQQPHVKNFLQARQELLRNVTVERLTHIDGFSGRGSSQA